MKHEKTKLAIFEGKRIRRQWNEKEEKWYFSVVDVVAVLTNSENPQVYWRVLKKRLIDEGSNETVTKCNGLKMQAIDGKIFSIPIFSIPIRDRNRYNEMVKLFYSLGGMP